MWSRARFNARAQLVIPAGPRRLTLLDAIETSLAQNPDLLALRQTENVSRAAVGVARAYPINPYVQIQVTPLEHAVKQEIVGAAPSTFNYVLLMHTMELAHQGRYRERAGLADRDRVEWTVRQAELLNVAQTQRLFFTALYMKGLRDVAQAAAALNRQLFEALEQRLAEGAAAEVDVAIAGLDRRSTRRQADLAEANYQTALLDLRRQLNLPTGTQLEVPGDMTDWRWLPATPENLLRARDASPQGRAKAGDDVAATLVSVRPDVMAARADVAFGRANVLLANAARVPNLQFGPYYQRDDFATTYWGFRTQFDVPVANSGRPMLSQREAELRQRQIAQEQIENRARREAETAIERYERARLLVEQTGAELTGTLPEELKHLEEEFHRGEVDILRIVQARTSLIQVRRTYFDTLNELALAAANLTAATGLPPTALVSRTGQVQPPAPEEPGPPVPAPESRLP